ncbi:hypothetical protein [Bradyrhizobium sp. BR 1433]|uniref:hypothetical protein n=1 Tax=Bradyrhizobium sp. BR 1433 TaxID=3447967 RepID=UPI003EE76B7E
MSGFSSPIGSAWTAYTPTVTPGSGAFTSVSATGRYLQCGKTVFFSVAVTITTNGTAAGYVSVSLPVITKSAFIFFGREDGVTGNALQAKTIAVSTALNIFSLTNTYPGGDGYVLIFSGSYEAN